MKWESLGGKGIVNTETGERRLWAIDCLDDLNGVVSHTPKGNEEDCPEKWHNRKDRACRWVKDHQGPHNSKIGDKVW